MDIDVFKNLGYDRKNIPARLFEDLSSRIISGELPGGYCFPNENELCAALGVGRSSLREAYAMLAQFGYIKRTKRGTFVNSFYEIVSSAPLAQTTRGATEAQYKEFRIMIEGELAAAAAAAATDEELEELSRRLELYTPDEELDGLVAADMSFHLYIAEISRNILLCNTVIAVSGAWKRGVRAGFANLKENNPVQLEAVLCQHRAVYEALCRRDGEEAKAKMTEHLKLAL